MCDKTLLMLSIENSILSMAKQGLSQVWGLLKRFPPFRHFPNFSTSPKYMLAIEYHIHIW